MKTKEEITKILWESFVIAFTDKLIKKNTTYRIRIETVITPQNGLDLMQIATWVNELIKEHENELETNGN